MASIATLRDLSEALIESAKQENKLDKITSDVEDFFKVLSKSAELKNVLWSATYGLKEREAIIRDIASRKGYDALTGNFLSVVLELDKFKSLLNSEQTFIQKLRKASGKIRAEIVMASSPSEEELGKIKAKLTQVIGQDLDIATKVDPSITF